MANNCAVKQYKKVVNDDNLLRIGELMITVSYKDGYTPNYITIMFNHPVSARIVGNGYFILASTSENVGKEIDDYEANKYKLPNPPQGETYNVYFSDKYSLTRFADNNTFLMSFDGDSFEYSTLIERFNIGGTTVNHGVIDLTSATVLTQCTNNSPNTDILIGDTSLLTHLAGYYHIPQSTFNAVAANLVEFSINREQSYKPDVSKVNCAVYSNGVVPCSWKTTKTGNMIRLNNVHLGGDVDTMLINMAALDRNGVTTIVVNGTSDYETDTDVQTAITTLRTKGITDLRINGVSPSW